LLVSFLSRSSGLNSIANYEKNKRAKPVKRQTLLFHFSTIVKIHLNTYRPSDCAVIAALVDETAGRPRRFSLATLF